jgi:GTP pyrophosphokinase
MNEQGLIKQCYYFEPKDLLKLKKALELSKKAHQNIYRRSGEPYFNHPLKVAETLAQMNLDPPTIIAALLHDLPEDTKFSLDDLRRDFGKEIAHLVDGVTKLGKVRIKKSWFLGHQVIEETPEFDQQVETLRKMFLAMAQDIRVILIKLADREHNMETLNALEATKQQRIARETLEIYARIADRLGMGELKGRLEDLAFPYIYPEEYHWLLGQVEEKFHERQKYLAKATAILKRELGKNHIEAEIHGRATLLFALSKANKIRP